MTQLQTAKLKRSKLLESVSIWRYFKCINIDNTVKDSLYLVSKVWTDPRHCCSLTFFPQPSVDDCFPIESCDLVLSVTPRYHQSRLSKITVITLELPQLSFDWYISLERPITRPCSTSSTKLYLCSFLRNTHVQHLLLLNKSQNWNLADFAIYLWLHPTSSNLTSTEKYDWWRKISHYFLFYNVINFNWAVYSSSIIMENINVS